MNARGTALTPPALTVAYSRLAPKILHRYVFLEIVSPFLTSLFVFTSVLFLVRILKLVNLVVNKNVPIGDIILLFSLFIPKFLEVAIPMSLLISSIAAFARLSNDSELIVIRATGASLKQLAKPVVAFALLACLLSLGISLWIRPWASHRLGIGLFEIAKNRASASLISGVFNELGDLTIYAEKIDSTGTKLDNLIINDRREDEPRNFIAKYGHIVADNVNRTLTLRLYNGAIHEGNGLNYNLTDFDVNNLSLDERELTDNMGARNGKKSTEMSIHELNSSVNSLNLRQKELTEEELKQLLRYKVEWHMRYVFPVSCILVTFVGMALGIQPLRNTRSWGPTANVLFGIIIIVTYYALLAFMSGTVEKSIAPVWLLMWIPNLLTLLLAYLLFMAKENENWAMGTEKLGCKLKAIFRWARRAKTSLPQ